MRTKVKINRKKLGSYPYFTVIFSITLSLLVLGALGLVLIQANKLSTIIKNSFEIQVYLQKNLSENQKKHIQELINSKKYLIDQATFISKEQAAENFIKETGEDFKSFLGTNPLRDAFILKIKNEYSDVSNLKEIKEEITSIKGVYEVEYIETLIHSINENVKKITLVLLAFAILLIFVVFILINNTIKLALFSQRFIIRSMQLVGATSWFIQRPFLWRALWQGFLSGILASITLYFSIQQSFVYIPELQLLHDNYLFIILSAVLVILGSVIGFLSSFRAINKYLKLSLNELY